MTDSCDVTAGEGLLEGVRKGECQHPRGGGHEEVHGSHEGGTYILCLHHLVCLLHRGCCDSILPVEPLLTALYSILRSTPAWWAA